jgi:hypothetical protein
MLHLTTKKTCICGYEVTVCIHVDLPPDPNTVYTVCCPMNASKLQVRARDLQPVDTCPPHAVGALWSYPRSRKPWWRIWG